MNRRQKKKASKKVTYPVLDEMNLLTLNKEEYDAAIKDFDDYVQKHCRYKHYKDKWKVGGIYRFPVGKEYSSKLYEQIIKTARKFHATYKII